VRVLLQHSTILLLRIDSTREKPLARQMQRLFLLYSPWLAVSDRIVIPSGARNLLFAGTEKKQIPRFTRNDKVRSRNDKLKKRNDKRKKRNDNEDRYCS
jgi:hypothetical protein